MDDDDALSRARRALQVVRSGKDIVPVDKAKINDLLTRARQAVQKSPEPLRPAVQAEPRALVKAEQPLAPSLQRQAPPHNPPLAVVTKEPRAVPLPPARAPAEVAAAAEGATANAPQVQTVIVQVQTPVPYPVYPYGYYPYPPYWPYALDCGRHNCPERRGVECRRWSCR